MFGLFGNVNIENQKEIIGQEVRRMLGMMRTASSEHSVEWVSDGAGFAVFSDKRKSRAEIYESNEKVLSFLGYVWNRDDLCEALGNRGRFSNDTPTAQILSTIFDRFREDGLSRINGRFALSIWEKREKTLTLINDRYGFLPMYYWASKSGFVFGSKYRPISSSPSFPRDMDISALGDFMALGYCTGDRTFFKHIRLLPPASIATFHPARGLSIESYWDYSFHTEEDPVWTEEDYREQFYGNLTKAMARQINLESNLLIPVSGGYDSRMLAGILSGMGCNGRISSLSYGHKYAYDVVYGSKIAKKCKFQHFYVPIESDYLKKYAEKFVCWLEGTVNCLNAHMLTTYNIIYNENIDSVITGFFGDIIAGSGTWIYSIGVRGSNDDKDIFEKQYNIHNDIMKDEDQKKYFNADIYLKIKDRTKKDLWEKYICAPSKNRYYRSRYFSLQERQRRYTSFNLYAFDHGADVVAPFMDNEFVDCALHVPPSIAIFQKLYGKVISNYFSKLANVPYNETNLPINSSWIRRGLQWRWDRMNQYSIVQASFGRKKAKMNDRYINATDAIRKDSKNIVIDYINSSKKIKEYFDMNAIEELIKQHMDDVVSEPLKLTALLTYAIWDQQFNK